MIWTVAHALRRLGTILTVVGLLAGDLAATTGAGPTLRTAFVQAERNVAISAGGLSGDDFELRIRTEGLNKIERGAEVNEPGALYLPPPQPAPPPTENVFFFNDLVGAEGWELVMRFAPPIAGSWKLNGRFSLLGGALAPEVTIPVTALEVGENLLHLSGGSLRPPEFYFRRRLPKGSDFSDQLLVAAENWTGRVELVRNGDGPHPLVVSTATIVGAALLRTRVEVADRWWENRDALVEAALAVGRNVLNAQVRRRESLFADGFNLVYDVERGAYRMPHWIWAWGPAIKLLLDLEKLEAAQTTGLAPQFQAAALAAGKRSLDFGITDPRHPAAGVSTVRWEPSRATPLGWAEYVSTTDSLFLAGWGWMSLYDATGEEVYLARTTTLAAAAERLMSQYPVIPQDWIVERNRWTPHTLDESVFGAIAFRRLFEATKRDEISRAGRDFLESHLAHMRRDSGLLARAWLRDEDKGVWEPDIKGHAWVMEGYLETYRISHDVKYLGLARALADQVMASQAEDGSWTYLFKKPGAGDPIDDKATAIWAYFFYELFKTTNAPEDLAAARRALGWCLRHQYRGADAHLDGAIPWTNSMAYVRRRPMTILYTTTFFGLAILEELSLSGARFE